MGKKLRVIQWTQHTKQLNLCIFQVDILLNRYLLGSPGLIPRATIFICNIKVTIQMTEIDAFLNPFALRKHTKRAA